MQKARLFKPKKLNTRKFGQRSASQKGYDVSWRRYRFRFLHYNPRCYVCNSEERINIDHIIAHKGDKELFKKLDNHMPLCQSCHSLVTNKFDKFSKPKSEEKIAWIMEQRKINGVVIAIKVLGRYDR